ncbi:lipid A biosynthesis (KDO)2-(lauroyl)-lipid IVA acyltransferase [SAR86 cluster bacterium SAR86E]|jgi:KDO2-lipid IV(A) lauroyltransferase|uniref:Lipid A biosynthesis (KDO)2-(Lauroyl)-lipid IVA acyltransferase n=1 Tax=SAR86 cluster bacterium SAR86E TaxID=1208365 RepID=K6FDX2_9GAMM|nr:lipid A biosynthesis (KDO)2-(lauroyl)-lipid IVA acyltransferase [SAR86 cluster bacterium SAR86E]
MRIIFFILSILPLKIAFVVFDIFFRLVPLRFFAFFPAFQVTKRNLSIAFPEMSYFDLECLSKESYKETLKSVYETFYAWSRSNKKIIYQTRRINNRFLFNNQNNQNGLILFALHNRSIDFMLSWIGSQRVHTSLYKKIKINSVNRYVKKIREIGGSKMVETGVGGVKTILSALENNQMTCMASDQVPADGLGTYSTFFNHECYSFSLAPRLAKKSMKEILMSYISYDKNIGYIMNFTKPHHKIYSSIGVDVMNKEMEQVIKKIPAEYSWEYKKFRKLSSEPKDIYKS